MIKNSKKALSVLLSLIMIMSIFTGLKISSFAGDDILNFLTYEINDGEVTITGCDSSISGDVIIPDTIEGYPVTKLADNSFDFCMDITGVSIGKNIKLLSEYTFFRCDGLLNLTVSEENTEYTNDEYGVLFNKDKTKLIVYPRGNSRTEYIIPASVTHIGIYAFMHADELEGITIPDGVISIGNDAFYSCDNLINLTLPHGATIIGDSAFSYCTNLSCVTIPSGSVLRMGNSAFLNCISLTELIIPEGVILDEYSIGYNFDRAYTLNPDFKIISVSGSLAETYATKNGIKFESAEMDSSLPPIENILDYLSYKIIDKEVTITDCKQSIRGDVILPDTIEGYPVTKIGDDAFSNCFGIRNIEFGDNVETIGRNAFTECDNLKNVIIPDSVNTINKYAFWDCSSLKAIQIGKGVTFIDENAFSYCDALAKITVNEDNTAYSNDEFGVLFNKDKTILITYPEGNRQTEYIIPDTVNEIGYRAFFDCNNITKINISENVKILGNQSFWACNITEIDLPHNVSTIGYGAFYDSNLSAIYIRNPDCDIKLDIMYGTIPSDATIYGYPGSTAEAYASNNWYGCKFIPLEGEPPTEEPTTEEPTTKEPVTDAPTTEPTTQAPETTTQKPVSDKLEVSGDTVRVDNSSKVSTVKVKSTADDILKSVKNEKVEIVDKDGKTVSGDALVGTGAKIQVMNKDGKVVNEYTVIVPTDIDGNGKTTAADARLALRASAKIDTIDGIYAIAADSNNDNKITAMDARTILRKAAGLE